MRLTGGVGSCEARGVPGRGGPSTPLGREEPMQRDDMPRHKFRGPTDEPADNQTTRALEADNGR